jgi:aminoglycoside phosphotransferase (APT) family kinase protein
MDEVPEARELDDAALKAMLRAVDPDLELREASPADRGFCSVYRLVADDGGETRELYLKASPDGQPWAIPTEARLQAVLATRTSMPVPAVLGAVDDHESLPTPFYLMEALPGADLAYERVGRLDDDALGRLATDTGRQLAALHGLSAVDAFGHVRHDGPRLSGGRPAGDPATLTVGQPRESWPAYLRERVDAELERHADSRFAGLTPGLRAFFDAGIEALEGPFEPALGRNDHGLHNLLVEPDTGAVTGMLDWGYTLAVPPAFDTAFAVYLYGGAFLAGLPEGRDRRALVRSALLSGYREVASERAGALSTAEPVYEALAAVRIMNDFEKLTLPDGQEAAVADRIEADVRALLEE